MHGGVDGMWSRWWHGVRLAHWRGGTLDDVPGWAFERATPLPCATGNEMYQRRFKTYAPATLPAIAMSKVHYFRVAR